MARQRTSAAAASCPARRPRARRSPGRRRRRRRAARGGWAGRPFVGDHRQRREDDDEGRSRPRSSARRRPGTADAGQLEPALERRPHDPAHAAAATAYCVAEVATWRPGSVAEIARARCARRSPSSRGSGSTTTSAFRTLEAVAAEKRALVAALPPDGIAVLNADDPHAIAMADGFAGRVISFGEAAGRDAARRGRRARPGRTRSPSRCTRDGRALPVRTRLHGRHSATSVLAALGVALARRRPARAARWRRSPRSSRCPGG